MHFDLSREWLETNGVGGFASSSVIGVNTRRYHALLCAATRAPQERMILVSKADETITVGDHQVDLGANAWPGAIHPNGYIYLQEFHLDPLPRWVWEIPLAEGTLRLQKTLWMPHGSNTTVVEYKLLDGPDCTLSAHGYVTGRDYHSTHHYNSAFNTKAEVSPGVLVMQPYDHVPLIVFGHDGEFYASGSWYYDFEWAVEKERGLDFKEDAYCPGRFVWKLSKEKDATWVISTAPQSLEAMRETKDCEIVRRQGLALGVALAPRPRSKEEKNGKRQARTAAIAQTNGALIEPCATEPYSFNPALWKTPLSKLRLGADQFVVKREDGLHTVLAGYHWFTDWGRDTMIALPGLCLSTGRFEVAASILRSFAGSMSQGMIPNRFPESNETPDYNTVDATLWFFHAVSQYGELSGDADTVREIYPRLVESIEWHLAGTRYGIKADDDDGLLAAGDSDSQLTWMDAKVGNVAFTPRNGKPVEIQALWYNALRYMATLARSYNDEAIAGICTEWSRKITSSFPELFWNVKENCLYDCISGDSVKGYRYDGAVRPNQLLAVSLPHRLLSREQETKVVAAASRDLLTPHGLRSLSPRDSRYVGIYEGDQWERDSAYHQGTSWGWLLGPFLTAYLRVNENSPAAVRQARLWMAPMLDHLGEAGLNSISEIFDGNAPNRPRGCIAQAWSVSEALRVLCELDRLEAIVV